MVPQGRGNRQDLLNKFGAWGRGRGEGEVMREGEGVKNMREQDDQIGEGQSRTLRREIS